MIRQRIWRHHKPLPQSVSPVALVSATGVRSSRRMGSGVRLCAVTANQSFLVAPPYQTAALTPSAAATVTVTAPATAV